MTNPCPASELLAAVLRGQAAAQEAEVAAHVADCPACQQRLESLAGGSAWLPASARLRSEAGEITTSPAPKLDFLQPAHQPGLLGRFAGYEVLEHVASGGMGLVLRARDPTLNRVVALKVLAPALAASALARARFVREARAAAAVAHEHVVPIYAVDECAGLPYLVMQFVQGRTLADRLRAGGPMRLEEILRIGAQTAAGLAAAHAQGLIHRDVKPGNILLENSVERVKLTDFGLARALDDPGLTRAGELAGTPEYMSPEQARSEPLDARTDLFSLGGVLYAMATGTSPFAGTSTPAVLRNVCELAPRPLREANPKLPAWFAEFVSRLLAKNKDARPGSAREVADLLEQRLAQVQRGEAIGATAAALGGAWLRRVFQSRLAQAAVAVLMVALAAFLLWPGREKVLSPPPVSSERAPATPPVEVKTFTSLAEALTAARVGGVIELAITGRHEVEPLIFTNELTLRAAPGHRPVLVQKTVIVPLITARAPLVLEGIEFQSGSTPDSETGESAAPDARPRGRRSSVRSPGLRVPPLFQIENAPFLMTHCRLVAAGSDGRIHPGIHLHDSSGGGLWHSEIYATDGAPLAIMNGMDGAGSRSFRLIVRHCAVLSDHGLLGQFIRSPVGGALVLERNTFAGGGALDWRRFPRTEFVVQASSNLIAVTAVMHQGGVGGMLPMGLSGLRWRETGNVYSVKTFSILDRAGAPLDPPLNDVSAWETRWALTGTGSTELSLPHLETLSTRFDEQGILAPEDFRPPPELAEALAGRGADVDLLGPGPAYERFRASPAYAEWRAFARAAGR